MAVKPRLAAMFFLVYGMFGSWYLTLGTYMSQGLGFDDIIGLCYGSQGVAAVLTVLFAGVIADRYLAAERLMAILALCSDILLFILSQVTNSKPLFVSVIFLHFLFFLPLIPLSSTIAFAHVADAKRQYPILRMIGSVGFLSASFATGLIEGATSTSLPITLGGTLGLILGFYSLTLPKTPPKAAAETDWKNMLGFDFLSSIKNRSFWVFSVAATLSIIPLSFYFAYSNLFFETSGLRLDVLGVVLQATAIQAIGHSFELLLLLFLPVLLVRYSIKIILMMGMASWVIRYILFAFAIDPAGANMTMLFIGILLHAVCQDFIVVPSQIYVEERFGEAARSRAQAFLGLLTLGIGPLIGANIAGLIFGMAGDGAGGRDWSLVWLTPAAVTAIILIVFAIMFKDLRVAQRH